MPSNSEKTSFQEDIRHIELDKIKISRLNVRKKGKDIDIDELANSIKLVGLLQPVVVIKSADETEKYELIVGQRRFLAHQKLNKPTILARVLPPDSDETKLKNLSLMENVHRLDLNHADAAEAITELYKQYGKDIDKVVEITGLTKIKINRYIIIQEQASEETKEKLREGQVTPADVKRVLKAAQGDISRADEMLDLMEEYKLDKHQKSRLVEIGEKAAPDLSAKEIVQKAIEPQVERNVIVPLPTSLRNGLEKAVRESGFEAYEIAQRALEHWLQQNGYLND